MKVAVIYTMKGCPFCTIMKEELKKENLFFLERDIHEYQEEYENYSNATQNEFVPAVMLLTLDEAENATDIKLVAPERDFKDIFEGVSIIKNYVL